jgi:predicted alpha/beta-hydrolase family hydrolase
VRRAPGGVSVSRAEAKVSVESVRRIAGVSMAVRTPDASSDPPVAAPAVLLGHGAGSDFHEELVNAVAHGVTQHGYASGTFNFPYRERGRRMPDRAPVLEACVANVAAAVMADELRPPWIVLGGKSMGGRMASQAVARGLVPCRGLLLMCYPLHRPHEPEHLRRAHLADVKVPMLFVSGTRDPLARVDLLEETGHALGGRATLHLVPDGDHSLKVPRKSGRTREQVLADVVRAVVAWLDRLR